MCFPQAFVFVQSYCLLFAQCLLHAFIRNSTSRFCCFCSPSTGTGEGSPHSPHSAGKGSKPGSGPHSPKTPQPPVPKSPTSAAAAAGGHRRGKSDWRKAFPEQAAALGKSDIVAEVLGEASDGKDDATSPDRQATPPGSAKAAAEPEQKSDQVVVNRPGPAPSVASGVANPLHGMQAQAASPKAGLKWRDVF